MDESLIAGLNLNPTDIVQSTVPSQNKSLSSIIRRKELGMKPITMKIYKMPLNKELNTIVHSPKPIFRKKTNNPY
jgi:hypothetical protein